MVKVILLVGEVENAGIGEFFLDCYQQFANTTFLTTAQKLGNFLLESATYNPTNNPTTASWFYNGQSSLDFQDGSAGIIDFLIKLSAYSIQNNSYLNTAIMAGNNILSFAADSSGVDRDGNSIQSLYFQGYTTGFLSGLAGIGTAILRVSPSRTAE